MKKLVIIILFLCFISPVSAQNIPTPQWSDFCPEKYLSAKPSNTSLNNLELITGFLFTASIFGSPIGIPLLIHSQHRINSNYWYSRKINFYKDVDYCQNYSKDLGNCYYQVVNSQKNEDIKREVRAIKREIKARSGYNNNYGY